MLYGLTSVILALTASTKVSGADFVTFKSLRVHPTRVLAKYKDDVVVRANISLLSQEEGVVEERFALVPGMVLFDFASGAPRSATVRRNMDNGGEALRQRIADLQKTGLFEYVEPDYMVSASQVPSDAAYEDGTLWGLSNTGQKAGISGADIDAAAAWDLSTGSADVIVAVIDSGIRYTHQDLAQQMWRNPGEIAGNGLDDDSDGYTDNVFGINAIIGTGDPLDDDGHGTHVAGTIGAAANDGNPHVGVAWNVQLMACKFLDSEGSGYNSDAIRCVNFAVQKGARILNNSWGGEGFQRSMSRTIAAAESQGVLFVAAAGNESNDNDAVGHYPSGYTRGNVIAVAGIDRRDKLADFSNFGASSVDLGAPGVEIYSSTSGSDTEYKLFSGTSMATPHVSGVAALVLARFPEMSVSELRERILGGVVPVDSLSNRTVSGGRLNAFNALNVGPDNLLKVVVAPSVDEPLLGGTEVPVFVTVTDLANVTDATVTGSVVGLSDIVFRNDGISPDSTPNDGTYSGLLAVPENAETLVLTVIASASGKTTETTVIAYEVRLAPENDDFADSILLAGPSASGGGSNWGATKESGEPDHDGNPGGASVWWRWIAPANGIVTANTDGSDFDTILGVYTGDVVDALKTVVSDDDSGLEKASAVTFDASTGEAYQIAVDGFDGNAGNISLSLNLVAAPSPPINDNFDSPIVIVGSTNIVSGSNVGASQESGELDHAGGVGGKSVWWTWTAPGNGTVVIKTDGSAFDTLLGIYTGTLLSDLTVVASDDDQGEGLRSLVEFDATSGTSYAIAVDGHLGATGEIVLSVLFTKLAPPPPNDLFENRISFTGTDVTVAGSNVSATKESGEPDHANNAGGKSVWWTWAAPDTGVATIATIATIGSEFDTLLGVYTGSDLSGLKSIVGTTQDPLGNGESSVTFETIAGANYQIAVDGNNLGFGAPAGSITLKVLLIPAPDPPQNDDLINAIPLTGSSVSVEGSNAGATREVGEPDHADGLGEKSVWWSWTAPTDGFVTVSTEGSDFDTMVAVYAGESIPDLRVIAEDDDDGELLTSRVVWHANQGQVFQIATDGFFGESGSVVLQLDVSAELPPGAEDSLQWIVGSADSPQGSEFVVPMSVTGFSNIASFQFSVNWDPAVLQFKSVEEFGLAGLVSDNFDATNVSEGAASISWEDVGDVGQTLADGTVVFGIRFELAGAVGSSSVVIVSGTPVRLQVLAVQDGQRRSVRLIGRSGRVGVESRFALIAGRVRYYAGSEGVPGVTVHLSGGSIQSVTTSGDGSYAFSVDRGGDYSVSATFSDDSVIGQGVTALDLAWMRRHILATERFDVPHKLLAADVDGSESITTLDLAMTKQFILGIRTTFPGGLWGFVSSDFVFADLLEPWLFDQSRDYSSLVIDALDQDFIGIELGDVNGSWTTP